MVVTTRTLGARQHRAEVQTHMKKTNQQEQQIPLSKTVKSLELNPVLMGAFIMYKGKSGRKR